MMQERLYGTEHIQLVNHKGKNKANDLIGYWDSGIGTHWINYSKVNVVITTTTTANVSSREECHLVMRYNCE